MISGIFTAVLLAAFLGIAAWAYSPRSRERFVEAAALPFAEDGCSDDADRGDAR